MLRWKDVLYYAKYASLEHEQPVVKSEEEWRQQLTPDQYHVLREEGTERPYRNAYCRTYEPGVYVCAACNQPLFNATEKYHAISGWPSFTQPIRKGAVFYTFDNSHSMQRMAVSCSACKGHLGHVFPDGPAPAGLRYCINSESLRQIT